MAGFALAHLIIRRRGAAAQTKTRRAAIVAVHWRKPDPRVQVQDYVTPSVPNVYCLLELKVNIAFWNPSNCYVFVRQNVCYHRNKGPRRNSSGVDSKEG